MKFITGGAFQGKRDFAEQLLDREGVLEYETADGAADPFEAAYSRKLVVNVQDYVRRFAGLEDGEARERLPGIPGPAYKGESRSCGGHG